MLLQDRLSGQCLPQLYEVPPTAFASGVGIRAAATLRQSLVLRIASRTVGVASLPHGNITSARANSGWSFSNMPRAGAFLLALAAALLALQSANATYIDPGDDDVELNVSEYDDDPNGWQTLQDVGKRACIRRGGNCDHRPGDCCHSSSCRCNLWGSNCRCQRMGLFQKWG
ncbi:unnamed protein product, partial [Iphiclides podalirius]